MASIVSTNLKISGFAALTETILTGADTFTYSPNKNQILIFRNPTAGPLSPVIDGAGGTVVTKPGIGSIDVSAGYTGVGSIAAGSSVAVRLDTISDYLSGLISISGGTGLIATLMTQ